MKRSLPIPGPTCWAAILAIFFAASPIVQASSGNEKGALRLREAATQFERVAIGENSSIPTSVLQKAAGIIVMRYYKGGFIFGARGGSGVAMVRDRKTQQWGPPAFLVAADGSIGLQIGLQENFVVFLIMNEEGMQILGDPNFRMGINVAATAGPHSVDEEGKFGSTAPILVYTTSQGLFAGAAFEGGALLSDDKLNAEFYRRNNVSVQDVLYAKNVAMPKEAAPLLETIQRFSKK